MGYCYEIYTVVLSDGKIKKTGHSTDPSWLPHTHAQNKQPTYSRGVRGVAWSGRNLFWPSPAARWSHTPGHTVGPVSGI